MVNPVFPEQLNIKINRYVDQVLHTFDKHCKSFREGKP